MEPHSYKNELRSLWNEFWTADDELQIQLASRLRRFLGDLPSPDSEDYYMWGLSIYALNQENVLEESHPFFLRALECDPNEYLARLYSAHCYHDKGDFSNALKEYLLVDQKSLKTEMPIWRYVKLLEQIGFCYTKEGNLEVAEEYFGKVEQAYLNAEPDELVPIQEAFECLDPDNLIVSRLAHAEKTHFETEPL